MLNEWLITEGPFYSRCASFFSLSRIIYNKYIPKCVTVYRSLRAPSCLISLFYFDMGKVVREKKGEIFGEFIRLDPFADFCLFVSTIIYIIHVTSPFVFGASVYRCDVGCVIIKHYWNWGFCFCNSLDTLARIYTVDETKGNYHIYMYIVERIKLCWFQFNILTLFGNYSWWTIYWAFFVIHRAFKIQ